MHIKPLLEFVCLHGSAKSVIAAEYFNRLAAQDGRAERALSAGTEPDRAFPGHVVQGLAQAGFALGPEAPRQASPQVLAGAARVVSFGPDLRALVPPGVPLEVWEDLPAVADGFGPARDAIVARVTGLLRRTSHQGERRP